MLILAAIVTFLSIWNAIYVPSMKESSEVEHLHNVEESFEKFSSDIDYAASSHQNNLVFSEPVHSVAAILCLTCSNRAGR